MNLSTWPWPIKLMFLAGVVAATSTGPLAAADSPSGWAKKPAAAVAQDAGRMKLERLNDRFRVLVGKDLFCEYLFKGYAKPIIYPIFAPGQTPMTRNYPMKPGVQGESTDHPHHKSLWFAHGDVNGESFWLEKGRIEHVRVVRVDDNPSRPVVVTENRWVNRHGKTDCTDTTAIAFQEVPGGRAIDYDVTLHAPPDAEVLLGDTKEGLMAIRTNPNLNLKNDPQSGVTTANGRAVNSRGIQGAAVWGQRAEWIDYSGKIDGRLVGVAIFDHPGNLRHPTYWHARDYGLVAANPLGAHDFTRGNEPKEPVRIAPGKDLAFHYRFVFHSGDADQAKIAQLYKQYCGEKKNGGSPAGRTGAAIQRSPPAF